MNENIDISEDAILKLSREVLIYLLADKTTKHNIIWATRDYQELGEVCTHSYFLLGNFDMCPCRIFQHLGPMNYFMRNMVFQKTRLTILSR